MKIKFLLFYFLFLIIFSASAQVQNDIPMREVLSTAGSSGTTGWGTIDYTIGEPVVTTESASSPSSVKWLTQGFQQPDHTPLIVKPIVINSPCEKANNGSINFKVISTTGIVHLTWRGIVYDSLYKFEFTNLPPGTYTYSAKDENFTITSEITITENDLICDSLLSIYQGITPNGDEHNDVWIIDGITNFKNNKVSIFNRWGDMVWFKEQYTNELPNAWDGTTTNGNQLPAATYFYLIEREKGKDKKPFKGWVELIR